MAPGKGFCKYFLCKNKHHERPDISFFRFPRESERCQLWVERACNSTLLGQSSVRLNQYALLCAEHFEDSQFMNMEKKKLIHNAVPAMFGSNEETIPPPNPALVKSSTYHKPKYARRARCCILDCSSRKEKNVLQHYFPTNVDQCKRWLERLGNRVHLKGDIETFCLRYRLCTKHFDRSQFTNDLMCRLNRNALPSIFEPNEKIVTPEPLAVKSRVDNVACNPEITHIRCSVQDCPSWRDEQVILFNFPSEVELCKKWLECMGNTDHMNGDINTYCSRYYLCAKHFDRSQFVDEGEDRLLWSAVPSIFQEYDDESSQDTTLMDELPLSQPSCADQELALKSITTAPRVNVDLQTIGRKRKLDIDVNAICRLCLRSDRSMKSIYKNEEATMNTLYEVLQVTASRDDGFPQQICHTCFFSLNAAYVFKKKCYENLSYLERTLALEESSTEESLVYVQV